MKRILLFILTIAAFLSCQKEDKLGMLEIEAEVVYLPATAGTKDIMVDATTEWRLEYPTSTTWMKTDLHGGKVNRKYFTVSFEDNPLTSVRSCDIKIYTTDRNDAKTMRLIQMPKAFEIGFKSDRMIVRQGAGGYSAEFASNVANSDMTVTTDSDWITLYDLSEESTKLGFYVDKLPATVKKHRLGYIYMSYTDEFERVASDTLVVRQIAAYPERAELLSFSQAKEMLVSSGRIEDNYKIEGYVTASDETENYNSTIYETAYTGARYIIESEEHEAIVLEAEGPLEIDRGDKVEIWLMDLAAKEYTEGSFRYTVFSNFTNGHVISSAAASFSPRKMSISDLKMSDVFTLVELQDVEIAPLDGSFTNFKESSPSSNATSTTHKIYFDYEGGKVNWMKSFPEYFRFYPTPLMDANGGSIYMNVSPAVSWAHEEYPHGSGTVTGIVVRECLSNFDIDETRLAIRPLSRDDIAIDPLRENGITGTLVDFTFDYLSGSAVDRNYIKSESGVEKFLPVTQQTTSSVPCTFYRQGAKTVSRFYSGAEVVGFQDKFRGKERKFGIVTQVPGNTTVTFLLENLCTKGITGALSMLVETNANKGTPTNPIQAKVYYSLDGNTWTMVDNSDIKFLCQFDRDGKGEAGNREPTHIPGFKFYNINLPAEICDKETVHLKIEQMSSKSFTKTVRIGSLTIKYNKK